LLPIAYAENPLSANVLHFRWRPSFFEPRVAIIVNASMHCDFCRTLKMYVFGSWKAGPTGSENLLVLLGVIKEYST
jgi:hypothetical protein